MKGQPTTCRRYRKLLGLGRKDRVPALVLLANAEDSRSGEAFEVYAFQKPAERFGVERVPRERAFSPESLVSSIISKNGLLPRDKGAAIEIAKKASDREPRAFWLHAKSDGWQEGRRAFSHRGRMIGTASNAGLTLQPPLSDPHRTYPLAKRGDAAGWANVMRIAHRSTRLRMSLCAAFAAPLLKVADLQSFTIVLAGRSKAGKSSALVAAGSIIGIGREGARAIA